MKILIVEDSELVVESVTLAFQLQWAEVEIVSSAEGGKAIDLVEGERPDLVLLDVGLPDMDGYTVLEAIREFSDIPVIMLTARDATMDMSRVSNWARMTTLPSPSTTWNCSPAYGQYFGAWICLRQEAACLQ